MELKKYTKPLIRLVEEIKQEYCGYHAQSLAK